MDSPVSGTGSQRVTESPRTPVFGVRSRAHVSPIPHHIKVLTYNIWFDRLHRQERTKALIELILAENADIVGLQEVMPPVLDMLIMDENLTSRYHYWSTMMPAEVAPYGVVFLSRWKPVDLRTIRLPTNMDRKAVVLDVLFKEGDATCTFSFATVHLESLSNAHIRKEQCRIIYQRLREAPRSDAAILMGDFNFETADEDENIVEGGFEDCWTEVNPNASKQESLTYDGPNNPMISDHFRSRLDRVTLRNAPDSRVRWKPVSMKRVGTRSGEYGLGERVLISDHYGLVCEFEHEVLPAPRRTSTGCSAS